MAKGRKEKEGFEDEEAQFTQEDETPCYTSKYTATVCDNLTRQRSIKFFGSGMFILDLNYHPGSRIQGHQDSGFKYFLPKKLFLRSRKYDSGCSSRIRILIFYPSRVPDPGFRGQIGTGSRISDPHPQHF